MAKKNMKFKRYEGGGEIMSEADPKETADKEAGLKASKGEDVGFLQRLRMGNIDDPSSEAYKRFGAGRAAPAAAPAPTRTIAPAAPAPTRTIAPAAPAMPAASSRPLSDDLYSDYGNIKGGVGTGTGEAGSSYRSYIPPGEAPSSRPVATKPVVPAKQPVPMKTVGTGNQRGPTAEELAAYSAQQNKKPPAAASQIPGQSTKAPQGGEKIDSSETERNINAALTATGLGGAAAGAYKLKKMYDASKAAKKALLKNPRLERPGTVSGKDFLMRDYEGAAKAGSKGVPKKQLGYKKDSDVTDVMAKKRGGAVKKHASGGMVSSASRRADGIATKGKTRGKMC